MAHRFPIALGTHDDANEGGWVLSRYQGDLTVRGPKGSAKEGRTLATNAPSFKATLLLRGPKGSETLPNAQAYVTKGPILPQVDPMFSKFRLSLVLPTALGVAFACHTEPAPCIPNAETPTKASKGQSTARKPVVNKSNEHGNRAEKVTPPKEGERKAPSVVEKDPLAKSHESSKANVEEKAAKEEGSCPKGMLLVEGEYCSKVDHDCEKSWYDESNKKTVCERFAEKTRCIGTTTKKRFCIDRYEWPNKKGERPEVMNKFHQAEVKCAAVGKRLCTESEWTMTCEGPKLKPFPYGFVRDTEICHGDVMWDGPDMSKVAERDPSELARLWKGVRSGSQPSCVSDYGVYDMPGNTDEVVASETYTDDFRGKFDSVHTGGPWYKGVRNQCRPKIYTHDEGFYYYFLSFRCCAEPDGKPTEPRTPKQQKLKWGFERVERIAGFTRDDVKKALEKKAKQGHCDCKKGDVRCNTICGTLLGPEAKDYPKHSKVKSDEKSSADP
jgi:formylglycine-generating enzyme